MKPGSFGGYLLVRPIPGTNRFAAAFYDAVATPAGGVRAIAAYVEFGRAELEGPF